MQLHRGTRTRFTAATLLSVLACVGLMLEQVRVPFHLSLHEHCHSNSNSDGHTDHHHDHGSGHSHHGSHEESHHPFEDSDEHCRHSIEDHFGELPQQALRLPSHPILAALSPAAQKLLPLEPPRSNRDLLDIGCPPAPPPPRPTAPRGPPSLV